MSAHTIVTAPNELERAIKRLRRAVWDRSGAPSESVMEDIDQMREMYRGGQRQEALDWAESEIDWWRN